MPCKALLCCSIFYCYIEKSLYHIVHFNSIMKWNVYFTGNKLQFLIASRLLRMRGTLKLICPSVPLSICLSVCHTNFNLLISSEVLMMEHLYLACAIIVTSPFYWYNAVTLTLTSGSNLLPSGGPHFLILAVFIIITFVTILQYFAIRTNYYHNLEVGMFSI